MEAKDGADVLDRLRNLSRWFLGAPTAALERKEIARVFRSVSQPGPQSAKTARGELEQHVAVRDLLTVVDRDLQDGSECRLTTRPCPPFSAGAIARCPPTPSNAECVLRGRAAEVQNPAWFIWAESHSGRSQRQPFDAAPRFLDPLRCRKV